MGFPETTFGICPECGKGGADYPAADLTSADSQSSLDSTGNGIELVLFRGSYMCQLCKQKILDQEAGIASKEEHSEEQKFRDDTGFLRSVP